MRPQPRLAGVPSVVNRLDATSTCAKSPAISAITRSLITIRHETPTSPAAQRRRTHRIVSSAAAPTAQAPQQPASEAETDPAKPDAAEALALARGVDAELGYCSDRDRAAIGCSKCLCARAHDRAPALPRTFASSRRPRPQAR